jgi:hypothetical protein
MCEECGNYFSDDDERDDHQVDVHNKCRQCGDCFNNKNDLKQVIQTIFTSLLDMLEKIAD